MNVYETHDLAALLAGNTYPGRGIVLGKTADGKQSVAAYFIMGRSENSRNRVFVKEPDGIRTQAYDPASWLTPASSSTTPSGRWAGASSSPTGTRPTPSGTSWRRAFPLNRRCRTRAFEPDGPNWTPRISGLLSPDGSYKLSILKSADAEGTACARYTFDYPGLAGVGHFLHTYVTRRQPHPHLPGGTRAGGHSGTLEDFEPTSGINLNEDNKISLYVRYTDLATGTWRRAHREQNQ